MFIYLIEMSGVRCFAVAARRFARSLLKTENRQERETQRKKKKKKKREKREKRERREAEAAQERESGEYLKHLTR